MSLGPDAVTSPALSVIGGTCILDKAVVCMSLKGTQGLDLMIAEPREGVTVLSASLLFVFQSE